MKDKNKKVTVIIISILIVLILLLAITFAFFRTELFGNDQIVKVGTLDLVLDETSEGISLDNAIGISDSEGLSLEGSTFKLINNGNKTVDYIIYLDDNTIEDTDTRIDDKYLKYSLVKNGESSGATLLTSIGSNPNRVLDSGTIEGKGTNEYSLNLWITDEVDGNYSGQVFSGKLRVEVSQERKTTSETLLANIPEDNLYDDGVDTFITGENPNNYIWYSGKLWRAVSINNEENTVKLVTQWNISSISYDDDSSAFEGSYMEMWLNDTSVDGFLGNLRSPENFIKMDSEWNASMMSDDSKPPFKEDGGIIVENPVGLLNLYEYSMSYRNSTYEKGYLNNGLYWWLLTNYDNLNVWFTLDNGSFDHYTSSINRGIRPSINLKSSVKIVGGNGTIDNPYRLKGDNDSNLSGTKLNTRYSGEYISFGTGDNNLYRIVSHETEGLTKVVSAEPLRKSGIFLTSMFGDDISYSNNNTIGTFLNGEYLNSGDYLTSYHVNMIEDRTTWYLGTVGGGENYRLSKYIDTNMSEYATSTNAKVGLLRLGELMAGQINMRDSNTRYWLLTPFNHFQVRSVYTYGDVYYGDSVGFLGIKPTLNLKSNVVITGGDGTKENPFQLSVQ